MSFKDKLNNYIQKKQMEIQDAKNNSAQKQADNQRKRINRLKDAKPGAITAIRSGLVTKANPLDVMKEEYNRRKYEREYK